MNYVPSLSFTWLQVSVQCKRDRYNFIPHDVCCKVRLVPHMHRYVCTLLTSCSTPCFGTPGAFPALSSAFTCHKNSLSIYRIQSVCHVLGQPQSTARTNGADIYFDCTGALCIISHCIHGCSTWSKLNITGIQIPHAVCRTGYSY